VKGLQIVTIGRGKKSKKKTPGSRPPGVIITL
jgi:hypothetical protein